MVKSAPALLGRDFIWNHNRGVLAYVCLLIFLFPFWWVGHLLVQCLQPLELGREAALAGRVDHQHHLPSPLGQVVVSALFYSTSVSFINIPRLKSTDEVSDRYCERGPNVLSLGLKS